MRSHAGGARAIAANARWRLKWETDRRCEASQSLLAGCGRPWLERAGDQCAFPMAGEGLKTLACGAPGRARQHGWASYCATHAAEIYRVRA